MAKKHFLYVVRNGSLILAPKKALAVIIHLEYLDIAMHCSGASVSSIILVIGLKERISFHWDKEKLRTIFDETRVWVHNSRCSGSSDHVTEGIVLYCIFVYSQTWVTSSKSRDCYTFRARKALKTINIVWISCWTNAIYMKTTSKSAIYLAT